MDASALSPETLDSLKNMSAKDKQDLNQFVTNENQKAQIQATVHSLADMCFKKCITSRISSGQLGGGEQSCVKNCVDRYMDANMVVIRHLDQMRSMS